MHAEPSQQRALDPTATPASAATDEAPAQRSALRGLSYDEAVQRLAPAQREVDPGAVHEAAARGVSGGGGGLPHAAAIHRSFGSHDVSDVSAHVGGRAADACDAMGASAYASGHAVAFREMPDLHTAAHEAAHIVQQRAGVSLAGGVGRVGDTYERHADAVADRVVEGKSAEDLLGSTTVGGGAGVQRALQMNMLKDGWARLKAYFTHVELDPEQEKCARILLERHNVDVSLMSTAVFTKHYNDAAMSSQDPTSIASSIADLIRPFQKPEGPNKKIQKQAVQRRAVGSAVQLHPAVSQVQRRADRPVQRRMDQRKIRAALGRSEVKQLLGEVRKAAKRAQAGKKAIKDAKGKIDVVVAAIDALNTPSKSAGDDVRKFQAFYKALTSVLPNVPVVSDFNDMMIEGLASVAAAFDTIFDARVVADGASGTGIKMYQKTLEGTQLMLWQGNLMGYANPSAVKPVSGHVASWLKSHASVLAGITGTSLESTGIAAADRPKDKWFGAFQNWAWQNRDLICGMASKLTGNVRA